MIFTGTFETETPFFEVVLRLAIAVALGGIVGLERELSRRPAGLRTHMMVCLAAATFTLLTAELISESFEVKEIVSIDPVRVIDAVVAGVAFLGAGAIISSGDKVKGLTTGASLWLSGAMGIAAGGGYYTLAGVAAFFAIFVLVLVTLVERQLPDLSDGEDEDGKKAG